MKLLMRDTSAAGQVREAMAPMPECAEVQVVQFPYSRSEIERHQSRVEALLLDARADPYVRFDPTREKIVVFVKNTPSVARAESRIQSDPSIPEELIVIERRQRAVADEQHFPPPEAYFPILNYMVRNWPFSDRPVVVRRSNLPPNFGPEHLRGLPVQFEGDECPRAIIEFLVPTELEDGAFSIDFLLISSNGGLYNPHGFDVRCVEGECFIVGFGGSLSDHGGSLCRS